MIEELDIICPGMWENDLSESIIKDWWAVCNSEGIIAYFGNEEDACNFKEFKIQQQINKFFEE